MKWLKVNLIMTCLAVVAACMTFMSNDSVANAMTLRDLQGTYRVMSSENLNRVGIYPEGTFIKMVYEDGDLVGIVQKPGSKSNLKAGKTVIADVFVSNNIVTCMWINSAGNENSNSVMKIYNNGNTIKIVHDDYHSWTMKRI